MVTDNLSISSRTPELLPFANAFFAFFVCEVVLLDVLDAYIKVAS